MTAAKGRGPRSSSLENFENYVHEGELLLVSNSAKEFCRIRGFDSYCHILTLGILVFSFCRVEKQENTSMMCGKLFLSEYFVVMFLKEETIIKLLSISTFIVYIHRLMC